MKTSISSDIWEKKKALIAKLYMEEEWPLKQVIKQIRSDEFNPSETQLRSRLKKWRVTKPSRQTRKKPQGSTSGDESERDVKSVSSISSRSQKSPAAKPKSISRSDWSAHPAYAPADVHSVDQKWNASLTQQQLTPTLPGEHVLVSDRHLTSFPDHSSTTASFEQHGHISPVPEGLMVTTSSAVTPTYATYPLSPESCFPSPGSSTTPALAQWPPRSVSVDMNLNPALHPGHWYHMPFEPITPPSGVPPSTTPVYRDHMPMVASHGGYPHEFAHYNETHAYHGYDPKPWKRNMSLQYDYHGRPEYERKSVSSHGHPPTMVPLPSSQPAGLHAAMCAPLMPYMGQDPMAQKPPGVGY